MTEVTWRRDATPARQCECGCLWQAHAIDTKGQACSSCRCMRFVHAADLWLEHRTVREAIG